MEALDRLVSCMEGNTCGSGETTIILLGSYHFGRLDHGEVLAPRLRLHIGNSQTGHTSGEDIWQVVPHVAHRADPLF